MKKTPLAIAVIAASTTLAGCNMQFVKDNRAENEVRYDKRVHAVKTMDRMTIEPTAVRMSNDMFIVGKSFKLENNDMTPEVFDTNIVMSRLDPYRLDEVVTTVLRTKGIQIEFTDDALSYFQSMTENTTVDDDETDLPTPTDESLVLDAAPYDVADDLEEGLTLVPSEITIAIEHNGSLRSLLDKIALKSGLHWKWENNKVEFFRTETRTFVVDVSTKEEVIDSETSSSFEPSDADGASANSLSRHTFTSRSEKGSAWDAAIEGIQTLMTDSGKISPNKALNTVIISDTPRALSKIEDYLDRTNSLATQQIAVKVDIFDVVFDREMDYGLDWNIIFDGSKHVGFNFASNLGAALTGQASVGLIREASSWSGGAANPTQMFIKALDSHSTISLTATNKFYTRNGKPVPITDVTQQDYIPSIAAEVDENGNISYTTETDTAVEGHSMLVDPRITSDGRVDLSMSIDLATINEFTDRTVGDNQLQLKNSDSKSFTQNVILKSGEAMVITGALKDVVASDESGIGSNKAMWAGGNRYGQKKKKVTMIMVTPYIMAK
ncbi:hypothetical protein [Neptuniibacter sp. QD37_11]|uniref:hypothetical protein n=1 Tax=Neptuniibacter sp. QD37_11 TaxID=3398209 RepID=UPI0039F468E2